MGSVDAHSRIVKDDRQYRNLFSDTGFNIQPDHSKTVITYQIDGESLAFMCDLVDAQVHHYADGSWEIIEILGKHQE